MIESHVKIMCPSLMCRKVLSVPATARGKTVRCKSCSTVIRIPDKGSPVTAPRPGAAAEEQPPAKGKAA